MRLARQAVVYTLLVHVVVLGGAVLWPVSDGVSPSEQFAEVQWMDEADIEAEPEQSYEEVLRQNLAQKVANLRSNAHAERSSELRSTALEEASQAELSAEVEAELKAMEAQEFARLSAEEKSFQTAGSAEVVRQDVGSTFESWDAQYDGLVTVKYSLQGRHGRDLDVPGYTCMGGAQIEVAIEVDRQGQVLEARLIKGDPESCFGQAAIRSAHMARFNASSSAPSVQSGMLSYVFVAQ